MRYRLRTLLVPRRLAGLRFTLYELIGLLTIAGISLSIGLSFLHDSLAVSLGIIGASLFNGVACYIVGIGIGRRSGRRLDAEGRRPPLRFTIRDVLWLTAVVAVLVAWRVGRSNWEREKDFQQSLRQGTLDELGATRGKFASLETLESTRRYRAEAFARLSAKASSRAALADEQIKQIDEQLAGTYWTYNPELEQFEALGGPGGGAIDWQDVALLLHDFSLDKIIAYRHHKRQQWLQE